MDIPTDDWYYVYGDSTQAAYLSSLYGTVLALMGTDCMPRNLVQTLYISIGVFVGALINANIFGELAVIMATMGKAEQAF
jgi:hypothetical protein